MDPQTRARISAALKRYYAAHPKSAPKSNKSSSKGGSRKKAVTKPKPRTNFATLKKKKAKRKTPGFKATLSTSRLRKG